MIADTLHDIEKRLSAIVANTDDAHPVDLFALTVIARQIGAQAEMLEKGLEAA